MKIPESFKELLYTNPVVLADAGAAGGIHERWAGLGDGLTVLGFEPDSRAFASLPQKHNRVWVNAALADYEGEAELLVTRHQTNTSLLTPNRLIIDRIYTNPSDFDVVHNVIVPCTTLDIVSQQKNLQITALKADTQGTELIILKGAKRSLSESILAVELEVEFTSLYQRQPLIPDIDKFMQDHGFMLFDLGNLLYHKWRRSHHIGGRKGQLIAADALYFRTPESIAEICQQNPDRLKILAKYWAVCAIYGFEDLAYELLLDQYGAGYISEKIIRDIQKPDSILNSKLDNIFDMPGRGRLATLLRTFADKIDTKHHSRWINPLGNK